MHPLRQLARGLRGLFRRREADQDVRDEVLHYRDQIVAERVAQGWSPEAARRAAELDIGTTTVLREQVRSYGWENGVERTVADVRYALRRLRRNPGFTAVSAITLALGIGATTAIFGAINPILFEPLPYPDPGRLQSIRYVSPDGSAGEPAFGTFREIAARSRAFEQLAAFKAWQPAFTSRDQPERLNGQLVTAGYFRTLGVLPRLGRELDSAEDRPRGTREVIISDALWRRRLGGDSAVVGRQLMLDDVPYTVLGVMPPGFENVLAPSAELWSLLQYDPALPSDGREWGHHLQVVGRLRASADLEVARRDLAAIAAAPVPEFARPVHASLKQGVLVVPLQAAVTASVRPALLGVVGAVVLLLLIACVNVTNLLLARGAQRRGEFAMRTALGAGRGRLVRQLLTESLLLTLLGGALGLLVAQVGVRALLALSPADLPRAAAIRVSGAVFLFALVATTLVGLAIGLVPAWQAARGDLPTGLQQASRRTAKHVTRRALVVAEVSLAVVLLVGAGLLVQSLQRLFAITPGFRPDRLLVMQVQASYRRFGDPGTRRFFSDVLAAARRVPGVESAAFTSELPLSGEGQLEIYGVTLEQGADPADSPVAFRYAVTPGYFETMGIPLRRGRLFDDRDLLESAARPIVVNESFVRRYFAGRDPLGRRLRFGGPNDRPWDVVVGVVGDVKQLSLGAPRSDAVYATTAQWLWADNAQWLVVRARGDAAALAPAVRAAVWAVDKDQPVVHLATMDALVAASEAQRRFAMIVFEAFALVALVLAATGIYGVLSGSVSERLREMGVRSALGARPGAIRGLVLRQGMALTLLGSLLGVAGAAAASRGLQTLLFGVSRVDLATYAAVIGLLLAVAGLACWLPAWRAARVDPAITLRAE